MPGGRSRSPTSRARVIGRLERARRARRAGRRPAGGRPWLGRSPHPQRLARASGSPAAARLLPWLVLLALTVGSDPGGRAGALGVQVPARLGRAAQGLDQRADALAARRRELRPVHLPGADPRDRLAARAAVPPRRRACCRPASCTGVGQDAVLLWPPHALVRADRRPRASLAHYAGGPRPRPAGGALLPLSRRVRPVGERDGDARLDRDRGAARRRCSASCSASRPSAIRRFERAITPVLDLMQTVPVFAYLVPILWFFGFNPVAAMIATIDLRDAADGPQHRAGAAARAGRGRWTSARWPAARAAR